MSDLVEETGVAEDSVAAEEVIPGRRWIKSTRLAFAAVLFGAGIFLIVQSTTLGYESRGTPGPGFFPFWVGILLSVLAIGWGIGEWRASVNSQVEQDLDPRGEFRVLRIVLAVVGLVLAFETLGYNLSVLALMLYLTFSMGKSRGRAWVNIVVSLAASFGVYLAFEKLLGVSLPDSIIPFMSTIGL